MALHVPAVQDDFFVVSCARHRGVFSSFDNNRFIRHLEAPVQPWIRQCGIRHFHLDPTGRTYYVPSPPDPYVPLANGWQRIVVLIQVAWSQLWQVRAKEPQRLEPTEITFSDHWVTQDGHPIE